MEKEVKRKDLVTVYGTGSSKFLPQGKSFRVHSVAAATLVEKGAAQFEKIEPSSEEESTSGKGKGKKKVAE